MAQGRRKCPRACGWCPLKYRPDPALTTALRARAASGKIAVQVTAGARRNAVAMDGEMVRVTVSARAVDGAANTAVVELVAAAMDLPRRAIRLHSGARGRAKILTVTPDD